MNTFDRRRIRVAALITVSILAVFWVLSSGSSNNDSSSATTCVGCADDAGNSAPSTTEYEPYPPLFIGGGDDPSSADPVSIATAPEPNSTEFLTTTQFTRYNDATDAAGNPVSTRKPRCSTTLAPDGALLTVTNVDNGQSTTCTNTQGVTIPPGVGMVLGTDAFGLIGDLADAPLPVRVRWDPDAPVDVGGEQVADTTVDTSGDTSVTN
ncbi:MAG: hypothetical protein K8R99_08720 [Actinomycetia bacterium]|nr:hypothetical protein [Actinomycetes bacterium]